MENTLYQIVDRDGTLIGKPYPYARRKAARNKRDKLNAQHGAARYSIRLINL